MKKTVEILKTAAVVLLPVTVTSVLSTARQLIGPGAGWDVFCLVLAVLAWCGAAVLIRLPVRGLGPMPKTGLLLSGLLVASVLLYTVSFAMEQNVLGLQTGIWALGRLFGGPAAVSAAGMGVLLGGAEPGAAAMLSCGIYLLIALTAALPFRAKK